MRPVILITGASSGIGAAVARQVAGSHDALLACAQNRDGVDAVADDMRQAGATVQVFQGDLQDPAQIDALFEALDASFGRLDVLINNAGVVDQPARIDQMDHARLRRMFDTNLIAPTLIAGAAVRRMSTAHGGDGGAIVNVSSAASRLGSANQYADYAASKAGLDIITKALADEVAREGIRVNSVRPGIIETDIHAKGGLPNRARDLAEAVPMGRAGTAEEVARTILWLASDEASYTTGTTLDVTGGR